MKDLSAISVLKASGEYEPFSEEKVRDSLHRAEVYGEFQDKVVDHLKTRLYDKIPTTEIYKDVTNLLLHLKPPLASKYHLKKAIMELGPTGFPFEGYFSRILEFYDYQIKTNQTILGKCVHHEIDIVAEKGEHRIMIECKFHNQVGRRSDIKDALYSYARFLDVKHSKKYHFNQVWLVTNTKATSEAIHYGNCVGMKVISWNYPMNSSLRQMVEKYDLHPITVLNTLNDEEKEILLKNGIVLCFDLLQKETKLIPAAVLEKAKKEAGEVCEDYKNLANLKGGEINV